MNFAGWRFLTLFLLLPTAAVPAMDKAAVFMQFDGPGSSEITARTYLAGCATAPQEGRSVRFVHAETTASATVRETLAPFSSEQSRLGWDVEIKGQSGPWSAPIVHELVLGDTSHTKIWMPWADPDLKLDTWRDPLEFRPFAPMSLAYGTWPNCKTPYFSVPLISIGNELTSRAVTLILSPEDLFFDVSISLTADGRVAFTRNRHRISDAAPVKFTMHIVAHEMDWRPAMGLVARLYPQLFEPRNAKVYETAGCGAYSSFEGELDLPKIRAMEFRLNWKASFDFPYMGMFVPPVASDSEKWPRFDSNSDGVLIPGKQTFTSVTQMRDYNRRMKEHGFHVLNYFNVTEFGAFVKGPESVKKDLLKADQWKDCNTFLYSNFPEAILRKPDGSWYGTWGGAVVMDPGEAKYQAYMLDQANRHIDKLPDGAGICIDRLDWMRFDNPRADDGAAWNNGPVRSLVTSWHGFMEKLGGLMHSNGKVIFVNNLLERVDLLRQVDGVYDEYGDKPHCLNASAFMCVEKPLVVWTRDEKDLRPDPDAFFQRHLHMGAFPTAPYPGNDHTIQPSEWADKQYLDYGPLLKQLRGRTWVYEPNAVTVAGGTAKANIFHVPGGFSIPVTFGKGTDAEIVLKSPGADLGKRVEVIHPGTEKTVTVPVERNGDETRFRVPLVRGCAMVFNRE